MSRFFATGLGGFVGRALLEGLRSRGSVIALDHSDKLFEKDAFRVVRGDINDLESYSFALEGVDTVIHMAAATGKAAASEFQRVNVVGTKSIVEACRTNGVRRLMLVSTIAVKFPNKRGYPYAESKTASEQLVRQSGLNFVIVRPTIVAGPSSPVISGLSRMASLPVLPLFGGGHAQIQPIHVDDLAKFILTVLDEDPFVGATLEFGGPEVTTIGKLLRELRLLVKGRIGPELVIPLMPSLMLLRMLEACIGAHQLPVTAGQLSSFCFDGTIEPNCYFEQRRSSLRGLVDMITEKHPE